MNSDSRGKKLFRTYTIWFLLFVCAIATVSLALVINLKSIDPQDILDYKEIISGTNFEKAISYTAKQQRLKVNKEIFFLKNFDRLQIKLMADEAFLVLEHEQGKTALIEQMINVICLMQVEKYYLSSNGEELVKDGNGEFFLRNNKESKQSYLVQDQSALTPMQLIRSLKAENADYNYKTSQLQAHNVKIHSYTTPGHHLINTPETVSYMMNGTARKIDVILGADFNFKATQFQASFSQGEFHL